MDILVKFKMSDICLEGNGLLTYQDNPDMSDIGNLVVNSKQPKIYAAKDCSSGRPDTCSQTFHVFTGKGNIFVIFLNIQH